MKTRLRRSLAVVLLVAVAALLAFDLSRDPSRQRSSRLAIAVIQSYQRHVSPFVARVGVRCRFTPSCSHYAVASIRRHGLVTGGWAAAKRIARCGPWTPRGTVDPPQ